MKTLLGTTALAVAMAASAFAQTATQAPQARQDQTRAEAGAASTGWLAPGWLAHGEAGDIHVSDMIGATIYAADANEATIASRDDWESAGVVNDILLTRDGEVRAILIDVGTFLGMGGKTVAAPLEAVSYVMDGPDADADDYFLVINADRDTLQGAPAYDRPSMRAEDDAMNSTMTTGTNSTFAYDGYDVADRSALTASQIESASVYGHGDATIGSISDLVVTEGGEITAAVIDVGGFLGMGARSVSVPFADLTVLRQTGGDSVRVYIDATKETLEAMPRHEG